MYWDHASDRHWSSDEKEEEEEEEESWKEKFVDIESCTIDDDKEKFVQIIRSLLYMRIFFFETDSGMMTEKDKEELSATALCNCIQFGAALCTKALLEGETGLRVNLNAPFNGTYKFPLHLAAEQLSYPLTELFLKMGAQPDVEFDFPYCESYRQKKWKPVHFALDSLKRRIWSTKRESVFRLIMELFLLECLNP